MKQLIRILYPMYFRIRHFRRFKAKYTRFLPGSIHLGRNVFIGSGTIIHIKPGGKLLLGDNTYIGEYCNLRIDKKIEIGCDCKIAQFVTIVDADYILGQKLDYANRSVAPIKIGNNVFIGAQACILKGSRIMDNEVIPCLHKRK